MPFVTQIITLIIFLFLSGFFSGSEVALVSLPKHRVRRLVENKQLGSSYVQKLKDNPQRMLATILIGNNLVNVGASAYTTAVMLQLFQNYAVSIATGVMTFLILVFGELTPKSFATQHNQVVAQIVSPFIWFFGALLSPIIAILDIFLRKVLRVTGISKDDREITEEEIQTMIKAAEEEGSIKEIERKMIQNIFEFDDIDVAEIATPRTDMIALESKANVNDAVRLMLRHNFSRIPVYQKTKDKVVGVVYIKDVMQRMKDKKDTDPVSKILKKPYFVPETKKISALLRQFQKRKEHIAIVVDEHGLITGVVTLEDVLEEIVGEIMDETDKVDPHIRKSGRSTWIVLGKTDIDEVNEKLKTRIKEGDYDTFSGFILNLIGKIPSQGEKIPYKNFTFKIEEVAGQRIAKVRVEKK